MIASSPAIVIARRLAIQLLHEAQVASPQAIDGVVTEVAGEPGRYLPAARATGEAAWARVYSNPTAPAVPRLEQLAAQQLTLMISLDTKGVLELRAWQLADGAPLERVVAVKD